MMTRACCELLTKNRRREKEMQGDWLLSCQLQKSKVAHSIVMSFFIATGVI
jgi:hypothetical protein